MEEMVRSQSNWLTFKRALFLCLKIKGQSDAYYSRSWWVHRFLKCKIYILYSVCTSQWTCIATRRSHNFNYCIAAFGGASIENKLRDWWLVRMQICG
jgi:hypothetical protein